MKITIKRAIAKAKLYVSVGGVPTGFHAIKTKKAQIHKRGAKPLKKHKINSNQRGVWYGLTIILYPFFLISKSTCCLFNPLVTLDLNASTNTSFGIK